MVHVPILPAPATFSSQLGQILQNTAGQVGQNLGEGYAQKREIARRNAINEKARTAVLSAETPAQLVNALSMFEPETQKQLQSAISGLVTEKQSGIESEKQFNRLFPSGTPNQPVSREQNNFTQPVGVVNPPASGITAGPAMSGGEAAPQPSIVAEGQIPEPAVKAPLEPGEFPVETPEVKKPPGLERFTPDYLNRLNMALTVPRVKDFAKSELDEYNRLNDRYQKDVDRAQDKAQKTADAKRRAYEADREFHTKKADDARKRADALRQSLPKKELALQSARSAVTSKEVGAFSLNNLAERLGIPEFLTAKGSQLITASKENLLSNMARTSAKAQNLWFEQRLNSMFPRIGQSEEANETIQVMLEGEHQMDQAYLKAYDELAEADRQKYGYERGDIEERAYKMVDAQFKDIMDKTSYKLREVYEREKGASWIKENLKQKVDKGTPLTPQTYKALSKKYNGDPSQTIENAKKLGYSIPTKDQYKRWNE